MHARHHTDVTPYVTPPHLTSHLGNNQTGDLRESLAAAEARLVAAEARGSTNQFAEVTVPAWFAHLDQKGQAAAAPSPAAARVAPVFAGLARHEEAYETQPGTYAPRHGRRRAPDLYARSQHEAALRHSEAGFAAGFAAGFSASAATLPDAVAGGSNISATRNGGRMARRVAALQDALAASRSEPMLTLRATNATDADRGAADRGAADRGAADRGAADRGAADATASAMMARHRALGPMPMRPMPLPMGAPMGGSMGGSLGGSLGGCWEVSQLASMSAGGAVLAQLSPPPARPGGGHASKGTAEVWTSPSSVCDPLGGGSGGSAGSVLMTAHPDEWRRIDRTFAAQRQGYGAASGASPVPSHCSRSLRHGEVVPLQRLM